MTGEVALGHGEKLKLVNWEDQLFVVKRSDDEGVQAEVRGWVLQLLERDGYRSLIVLQILLNSFKDVEYFDDSGVKVNDARIFESLIRLNGAGIITILIPANLFCPRQGDHSVFADRVRGIEGNCVTRQFFEKLSFLILFKVCDGSNFIRLYKQCIIVLELLYIIVIICLEVYV